MAHASDLLSLRRPGVQTQRAEDESVLQAMARPQDSSMAVQSASQVDTQGVSQGVLMTEVWKLLVYDIKDNINR